MEVIFTIAKQLTFRITKTWTTERINVSEQINGKCTGYKQRTTAHATHQTVSIVTVKQIRKKITKRKWKDKRSKWGYKWNFRKSSKWKLVSEKKVKISKWKKLSEKN